MSSPSVIAISLVLSALAYAVCYLMMRRKATDAFQNGKLQTTVELSPRISGLEATLVSNRFEIDRISGESQTRLDDCIRATTELNDVKLKLGRAEAELSAERNTSTRRIEDEALLSNRFAALARTALSENSSSFLETAKKSFELEQESARTGLELKHSAFIQTLQPVQERLTSLDQHVERLSEDKDRLATEAKNLSNALKKSEVRGRWGEINLQRVAELAGMKERCDFSLQVTISNGDESRRRPDMVVNLPMARYVVVDSKAVMDSYVSACGAEDAVTHAECMAQHAKNIRNKIDELAKVDYARVLEKDGKNVADMVVCFIPGEAFFSAAIDNDPLLLEYAARKNVFLASPTILIVLLRAIALGWRDHELSQNAEEVRKLGKELYSRLASMKEHFDRLGMHIDRTVTSYNGMVSSLNRKVFPQARRFQSLGATEAGSRVMSDSENIEQAVNDHASADWHIVLPIAAGSDPNF